MLFEFSALFAGASRSLPRANQGLSANANHCPCEIELKRNKLRKTARVRGKQTETSTKSRTFVASARSCPGPPHPRVPMPTVEAAAATAAPAMETDRPIPQLLSLLLVSPPHTQSRPRSPPSRALTGLFARHCTRPVVSTHRAQSRPTNDERQWYCRRLRLRWHSGWRSSVAAAVAQGSRR
jgi:hypothetical protein